MGLVMSHFPPMSPSEYRLLVEQLALKAGEILQDQDGDERVLPEEVLRLAEQECEGYDPARLCSLLSFADKGCVADAVLVIVDNHDLERFPTSQALVRRLASRALALEAQEIAFDETFKTPPGGGRQKSKSSSTRLDA